MEEEKQYLSPLDVDSNNIEELKGSFDTAIVVLQGGIGEGYEGSVKIPYPAIMRMYGGIIKYYSALDEGKSPVLILSGGATVNIDGVDITEAEAMKELLVKYYDVEEWRVIPEIDSIDTISNAVYTGKILEKLGLSNSENNLLITNDFHLIRSDNAFKKYSQGLYCPLSAEKILVEFGNSFMLPGDQFKRRYGEFSELFLESKKNKYLSKKDKLIEIISNLPGGRDLLLFIAKNTRR